MNSLSDKFSVIIEKFLIWSNENGYLLNDLVNNSKIEWDMKLLSNFKEPGRNKLETFVKKLNKEYLLTKDNEKVLDIKLMVNNFKENKPKTKVLKEKKVKSKEMKVKEVKLNNKKENIYVDFDLDTNNSYNIDTLEYFTSELIKAFGKPKEIENEDSKYEWKLSVNGDIYSIYDWIENKESFTEITWYLAGFNENNNNIKEINRYIDEKIKEDNYSKNEIKLKDELIEEKDEITTDTLINSDEIDEEKEMKELFGDETDNEIENEKEIKEIFREEKDDNQDEDKEINLDMISETLEIDIDDLDF
jgi:hypothetical protein